MVVGSFLLNNLHNCWAVGHLLAVYFEPFKKKLQALLPCVHKNTILTIFDETTGPFSSVASLSQWSKAHDK